MAKDTTPRDAFGQPTSSWRTPSPSQADPQPRTTEEPAGWWARVAGWIVDGAATIAAGVGVGALAADSMTDDSAGGVAFAATLLFWLLNTTVLVGLTGGQSLGKLIGGMRLINEDGSRVGAGTGFRRDTLLRLPYVIGIFFVVDSLWPLSSDRRTLRDKFARTLVIREPSYGRRAAPRVFAAVLAVLAMGGAFNAAPASWTEEDYSSADHDVWMEACGPNEITDGDCECAWDRLTAKLSYSEFEPLLYDGVGVASKTARRALDEAYQFCAERGLQRLKS